MLYFCDWKAKSANYSKTNCNLVTSPKEFPLKKLTVKHIFKKLFISWELNKMVTTGYK